MSLRFRPAHISVINRRACHRLLSALLPGKTLQAHQRERVPTQSRPSAFFLMQNGALAQGSAAPRQTRRALARSAPFRPGSFRDGRLRREHSRIPEQKNKMQNSTQHIEVGLTKSLHINWRSIPRHSFSVSSAPGTAISGPVSRRIRRRSSGPGFQYGIDFS